MRQKLDQYYAQEGRGDPVLITIAKGSYTAAFSLSCDGDAPAGADLPSPALPSIKPSIAVLPFDDFSREQENQYFASGLTEETIANLSRFKELSVFSRLTTEQAKLRNLSIKQIYDEFRPDFVLEGSFRIDNEMVNITINLVDASSAEIILTQHFSRSATPEAMYVLQNEMSLAIATWIADRFGPLGLYARRSAQLSPSLKWQTYSWISRYYQFSVQLSEEDRKEIQEGVRKALESDPTSSDAHAVLALTTVDQYRMWFAENTNVALLDQALHEANLAVLHDPENAAAHKALAIVQFHRREFDQFEAEAQQALSLNPGHPDMFAMLGICYCVRANWSVAMPLLNKAIAHNPLQPGWYHIPKAICLAMTRGPKEALAETLVAPLPGTFYYHCYRLWFLVELDQMVAAQLEKAQLLEVLPDFEQVILPHLRAWCFDKSILDRAVAAWQKAGLEISQ
ncbi:hypothetical protein [Roseovarius arcticus]|uniref:hypothetical protein n=1 Tax=Roseovarius arcticus TaxID=2547404 RepID=UPI001110C541|nr:hypothetical protein [Roseovarius arcticus]